MAQPELGYGQGLECPSLAHLTCFRGVVRVPLGTERGVLRLDELQEVPLRSPLILLPTDFALGLIQTEWLGHPGPWVALFSRGEAFGQASSER